MIIFYFSLISGVIVGGRVTQYLLEKSRIVTQASEERNYHVFYELLAGLDQQLRDKYGLLTPDKYFYLNQVSTHKLIKYAHTTCVYYGTLLFMRSRCTLYVRNAHSIFYGCSENDSNCIRHTFQFD